MSHVVGIDLSSKAIDLVKLDEDSNRAEWVRCELEGKDAWERTLTVRDAMRPLKPPHAMPSPWSWWDDVYLVAIEAPYGRGQAGTNAILNRVVGAVAASLPAHLRAPERCWVVRPDEYRTGLGLRHNQKPTWADLPPGVAAMAGVSETDEGADLQNYRDAYALAWWARDSNRKAIEAAA